MSKMFIQDRTGDTVLEWDVTDKASVTKAEKVFDDLMKKQHMAYKTGADGKSEIIKAFEPTAEEIVVAVPLAGG